MVITGQTVCDKILLPLMCWEYRASSFSRRSIAIHLASSLWTIMVAEKDALYSQLSALELSVNAKILCEPGLRAMDRWIVIAEARNSRMLIVNFPMRSIGSS